MAKAICVSRSPRLETGSSSDSAACWPGGRDRLTDKQSVGYASLDAAHFSRAARGRNRMASEPEIYDLVFKGGRVVDPAQNMDRVADVAIRNGRIAAIAAT